MKKLPTFQEQVHFMSRQADLLDEQGNDVSAGVMRDAMNILVAEHGKAERFAEALRQVYRDLSSRKQAVNGCDGKPIAHYVTEALHG